MYLSKLTLQHSAQAREALLKKGAGAYTDHQLVWECFTKDEKRRFLFREEPGPGGMPQYWVLSPHQPEISQPLFHIQSKPFQPQLSEGQKLAFQLRANPTVCKTSQDGKRQHHDVLMEVKHKADEALREDNVALKEAMYRAARNWLTDERRCQRWGIRLDTLPDADGYRPYRKHKKSGHRLAFSSVDFQGVMTIVDPENFWKQYSLGFGRAKAFGCGLMLIRPVN